MYRLDERSCEGFEALARLAQQLAGDREIDRGGLRPHVPQEGGQVEQALPGIFSGGPVVIHFTAAS